MNVKFKLRFKKKTQNKSIFKVVKDKSTDN